MKRKPRRPGAWLYVAVEKEGRESREWSKIGFSCDPKRRCSGMNMHLVACWHRPGDGLQIEWHIKQTLEDFLCLTQSSEIFAIPAASLVQYADSVISYFDNKTPVMALNKIIGGKRGIAAAKWKKWKQRKR
jgi:hypothetical protein